MINQFLLDKLSNSLTKDDLEAIRRSGYGSRQGFPEFPALLVVDMTLSFLGLTSADQLAEQVAPTAASDAGWSALENIKEILDISRSRGLPVVFTHPDRPDGIPKPVLRGKQRPYQGRADQFPASMLAQEGELVLPKEAPSAFFKTNLAEHLRSLRVDGVIVTGIATAACVRATVVDAASHGFKAVVPIEAVADWMEFEHWASLLDMDLRYADVMTTAEVLQCLAG
jgi:nicotinamidase-related amidase